MDLDLKLELRAWRREKATAILGRMTVRKWGDIIFMSDETIQRIVDCTHENKISTAAQIAKETRWRRDYVDQCADSLLAIINRYALPPSAPPALPASQVLAVLTANESSTSAPAKRQRQNKCSACGGLGHNSMCITITFPSHVLTVT